MLLHRLSTLMEEMGLNYFNSVIFSSSHYFIMVTVLGILVLYYAHRRKSAIYLLDFSCYRPLRSYRIPMSMFKELFLIDNMDPEAVSFQCRILEKSGFSEETSLPPSLARLPKRKSITFALEEAETIMYEAISDLLQKSKINPKAIDILIINCSLFCPTPSLCSMVANKFRMRSNIISFNLSGMGCSAGLLSVSLAKDLLRVHRNSLALIVSTEVLSLSWYMGKVPSMLLSNCLFRMGGAAVLMSSRAQDKHKAKYKLLHLVRTTKAQDDQSHGCVYQDVDPEDKEGVSISKNIVNVAGNALKTNITSLGPLVLPITEQFQYGFSLIWKKLWATRRSAGIYTPDFHKAFDHFCIHAGGRAVIQAIETNLGLKKQDLEASSMTLHRFGNTSSSSIWYVLCYIEAKGRMKCGDRIWQIAFGSGFKCNSAVWKCVCDVKPDMGNAWSDVIDSYPVQVPDFVKID
ncbi:hypothetical protein L6164_025437 [Bauhinia variegata]|uniref:Uncharacterized protein n=1 Tax=Bauhinia variegata TaxID=167791 RepID=A0ACB9M0Q9_BAUVA|nr:hypothetical protein L6164_025437 [Bauhinia variegata]